MIKSNSHPRNTNNKDTRKFVVSTDLWAFLKVVHFHTTISTRNCQLLAARLGLDIDTLALLIAAYGGRVTYGS